MCVCVSKAEQVAASQSSRYLPQVAMEAIFTTTIISELVFGNGPVCQDSVFKCRHAGLAVAHTWSESGAILGA